MGLFDRWISKRPARLAQMQADLAAQEAAAARQREEERQKRIELSSKNIEDIFNQIPDTYYSGVADSIKTLGTTDLTSQFTKAKENLQYALARSGLLSSSVATDSLADITSARDEGAGKIAQQAEGAVTKVKQQTATEKQNAINQLYATQNPDLAANTALTNRTLIMQDKPSYSPIGDIFGSILTGLGAGVGYMNNQARAGQYAQNPNTPSAPLPTNSGGTTIRG